MSGEAVSSMPAWLRLGRVSNLPTVLSNALAAALLGSASGGRPLDALSLAALPGLMLSMCLFYVGGMYLNDAFDREIDARERPQRPIPSGEARAQTVFACGFGMLLAGWLLLGRYGNSYSQTYGALLACSIVLYNIWHKNNPCSPLLMGACRALLCLCVGSAFAGGTPPLLCLAAALLLAHIVGLSHAAKQESLDRIGALWPLAVLGLAPLAYALLALARLAADATPQAWQALALTILLAAALAAALALAVARLLKRAAPGAVGQAVAGMIAAVSLLDGLALAAGLPQPAPGAVLACAAAYCATRVLQTYIPGT
ncbi:UbiA family prenyltransferase [Chromobacterium violaceum]|uniref:UbiA family prenyltransferase n=1 Tax=Chromobacterium violaceum TaxID=536 RepID=UPI0035A74137